MNKTYIDPAYLLGEYYTHSSLSIDVHYKAEWINKLLVPHISKIDNITKVADVGCGTGGVTLMLGDIFASFGYPKVDVTGYDFHPEMDKLTSDRNVSFVRGDFFEQAAGICDIVLLLDVIEHIVEPQKFLLNISQKTRFGIFHIPLDDSLLNWFRNTPQANLHIPGHISVFNSASAINLITNSGWRLVDYNFTPVFSAPSGRETRVQRVTNPVRSLICRFSPGFLSKTLGGISMMVLAKSVINP